MKKWISLILCFTCTFSSMTADGAPPVESTEEVSQLAVSPELATDPPEGTTDTTTRKQVGEAAADGSKTAGSGAGKYVLAACAVIVAVAALLLVSTHSGKHKK